MSGPDMQYPVRSPDFQVIGFEFGIAYGGVFMIPVIEIVMSDAIPLISYLPSEVGSITLSPTFTIGVD